MLTRNTYFEGKVESVGFERHGRKQTVGVLDVGEYRFTTDGPERMWVVSGEIAFRVQGKGEWQTVTVGGAVEIAKQTEFDVRASAPSARGCRWSSIGSSAACPSRRRCAALARCRCRGRRRASPRCRRHGAGASPSSAGST